MPPRDLALKALREEHDDLGMLFSQIDDLLISCAEELNRGGTSFCWVTALTVVKGRRLAICCRTLILEMHGQEAGAVLRPLIECIELAAYLRDDPSRVQMALEDKLPTAGKRARIIEGEFQGLRNHLNEYASHASLRGDSIAHLLDFEKMQLVIEQPFDSKVLRRNLQTLVAISALLACEAARCVETAKIENSGVIMASLNPILRRASQICG